MAEGGSAVGHIKGEADALGQHFVHAVHHILGRACLVPCAPFVEPSAPEFRAHLGRIGSEFAQTAELLVDVGSGAEVHCPGEVIKGVLLEVGIPVALEERHLVKTAFADDVPNLAHIFLVRAVRTVFVLHLHHDDGATVLYGQRSQLLAHFALEQTDSFHEVWVRLAQADVLLLEQPPRQAAHFPFGTDVRTGTHNDIHAILLYQTAELGHIGIAGKVVLTFLLFVEVPEDIEADGIHTQCLAHLDAVFPIGAWNAWIVQLCGLDHKGLAVEQERTFAGLESTGLLGHAFSGGKAEKAGCGNQSAA